MKKMNVNYRTIILASIVTCFFVFQQIKADRIVGFFFEPYPGDEVHAATLSQKLQKPGKVAKCMLNGYGCYSQVAGIFSSYAGYLKESDVYGWTSFPKKQDNPRLYLVITPVVTPVFMFANTIHHWQIEKPNPVATYLVERKQDETTKLFYWEVAHVENPEDNAIPIESLLIIADPDDIVVPEGITMADDSQNLLLPRMYVKKGIKPTQHAFYMLNLTHLFGPIKTRYKKFKKKLITLVD